MMLLKSNKPSVLPSSPKKEIAVKNRTLIFSLSVVVAIILIISGATIYYYSDKIALYNALAKQDIAPNDSVKDKLIECDNELCIAEVIATQSQQLDSGDMESLCNKTINPMYCMDKFYYDTAILKSAEYYCGKIMDNGMRDNCYFSVYLLTNDTALCEKLESSVLKSMCD